LFHTKNWGQILIWLFENNKDIGLVGSAGATYKTKLPSGWSSTRSSEVVKLNMIQQLLSGDKVKYYSLNASLPFEQVVTLDGCFLCTRKEVTDSIKFDEETFKGYHCYDVDYALQVNLKYKVVVSNEILIEHLSEGTFKGEWLKEVYILAKKWNKYLPIYTGNISKEEQQKQEYTALLFLMNKTLETRDYYFSFIRNLLSVKAITLLGLSNWHDAFRKSSTAFYYRFLRGR
jgi:GT2 family glycosyltransferase